MVILAVDIENELNKKKKKKIEIDFQIRLICDRKGQKKDKNGFVCSVKS
jgi:hypothetical protein